MSSVAADVNTSVEFVSQPDLIAVSPQLASKKAVKPRKKKQCTPLVDTSVRRCTRSMAKLDGFRAPITQDGQPRKKYKKTRKAVVQKKVTAQKKAAAAIEISAVDVVQAASKEGGPGQSDGEKIKDSEGGKVTPPLPIPIIQQVGELLDMDADQLTVAKLMANNPVEESSRKLNDS
jgi:hypothetical protein